MKDIPIYHTLKAHQKKDFSSFHTPGHKNAVFFPQDLLSLDYTELPDTDALYEASGILRQAEEKLSALFGAYRTLISCGGCTLAIQTMLRLACRKGHKMLLARNSHRSAVNACALLGIEPLWLLPQNGGCFTGTIAPDDVERALQQNPDSAACYLTSPTYYGELSDIRRIAEICHRHNVYLLVDNAHGSHLAFLHDNQHPIALGADASACSLHKTLPVLTGGAVLNIAAPTLAEGAKEAMALFGSTSPSYPIMASIDCCREYLQHEGIAAYRQAEQRVAVIKQLADRQGLWQPQGTCDPLRVCVNTACAGVEGIDRQTDYFHRYAVEPEFCDGQNAVFLCTPFNQERDFIRLETALSALQGKGTMPSLSSLPLPEQQLSPREAMLSPTEMLPLSECTGHIAADSACPCPPGIPAVMPGEVISSAAAAYLAAAGHENLRCVSSL